MDKKKPSGAEYKRRRKEKEKAAVENTPKLTDLFSKQGLFVTHFV